MPVDGLIVIDKPQQMSSAKVVSRVKRVLKKSKVGHTGTLDPYATGVLVCCVGRATRLARFFLHGRKRYEATLHLGIVTDTQDLTGNILQRIEGVCLTYGQIETAFKQFEGPIEQTPPVFSALKHQGVPLYRLARKGTPVQKPPRLVTVYSLRLLEVAMPLVRFEAYCSGGTYVRTLCADIGNALGCGGHLAALRRIENNGFGIDEALTLDELERTAREGRVHERIVSMAEALRGMEELVADQRLGARIRSGQPIKWSDLPKTEGHGALSERYPHHLKIVDPRGELLAVMEAEGQARTLRYCCVFSGQTTPLEKEDRFRSAQADRCILRDGEEFGEGG